MFSLREGLAADFRHIFPHRADSDADPSGGVERRELCPLMLTDVQQMT